MLAPAARSAAPTSGAKSPSPYDAGATTSTRRFAEYDQGLQHELAQMRQAQPHWEASVGGQVSMLLQHYGEAAQHAMRILRHTCRDMYEFHKVRILQTCAVAEEHLAEERAWVEQGHSRGKTR